jgi:hypothetical protein
VRRVQGNGAVRGKTRSRITDFAILYWVDNAAVNVHGDDETDEVFLIDMEYIPILIEVKRAPSRTPGGDMWDLELKKLMLRAQEDVFRQVGHVIGTPMTYY